MSKRDPKRIGTFLEKGKESLFGKQGDKPVVVELALERLKPNPEQQRTDFSPIEIGELADSIKERGLLQPIRVARDPEDRDSYIIIAGERRVRAMQLLERSHIYAILTDWQNDQGAAIDALIENAQRENLSPIDLANGLKRLEELGLNQSEIGDRIGKSRSFVNRSLKIAALPEQIKAEYPSQAISSEMLFQLAYLETEDEQLKVWERIKSGEIKSRDELRIERSERQVKPARPKPSESGKTLDILQKSVKRLEKLANDDVRLDYDRLAEFRTLYERFSAALGKLEDKEREDT